jgi:hypothetical protein
MIGWPLEQHPADSTLFKDGTTWSVEAERVHGIPIERVRDAYRDGRTATVVAREAADWLMSFSGAGPRDFIAVGWNVGSFDFPFVQRFMPELAKLFSYRFQDLNSVCFTLAQAGRRRAYRPEHALGFESWKKRAKKAAESMIGGDARWHDAGYDALASLLSWWWLCDRIEPREGVSL